MSRAWRKYGFWTLTFLVVANMIGAGVFTTSGFSLADLKSRELVLAAWVVGGLIAIAGAASYGQLARLMPESGGEYLFLSRAAHPMLGFIAGWVSIIAGFSGALAFAATTFEVYLVPDHLWPLWLPVDTVAVTAIAVAAIFHGLGRQLGALTQNFIVILKLCLLGVLLIVAASQFGAFSWGSLSPQQPRGDWSTAYAFAGSLVWISLSYSGFNAAVYVASEAENPSQTVPKALILGTLFVALLYFALNVVFVYAPPVERVVGTKDVAAVAAEWLGGARFATFVRLTISAALLTSVFSMIMAAPRVYAKMADDGLMPEFLRFNRGTPRLAIAAQVYIAVVLVLTSSLRDLLDYLSLTLSICAACSVMCLLLPRVRTKPWYHPSHLVPLFFVAATLMAATLRVIGEINQWQSESRLPKQLIATALTFAFGAVMYFVVRDRRSISSRLDEPE